MAFSSHILERAYNLDPFNNEVSSSFLDFLIRARNHRCKEVVKKIEACASNFDDEMFILISQCMNLTKAKEDYGAFKRRGLEIVISQDGILKENYLSLLKTLVEKKIQLVAMQYPTLSISALKEIFDEVETGPVTYISNETNFKKTLTQRKSEEIFQDRFRGSWDTPPHLVMI